jgi:hypothetical protein
MPARIFIHFEISVDACDKSPSQPRTCFIKTFWFCNNLSNWEFIESIFPTTFASQGALSEDPMVCQDGACPPPFILLVLPLPSSAFDKAII